MRRFLTAVLGVVAAALAAAAAIAVASRLPASPLAGGAAADPPAVAGPGVVQEAEPPASSTLTDSPPAASSTSLPDVLIDPRVVIVKGSRRLTVFSEDDPVKSYAIALGPHPVGHKTAEGDGRTPEGEYYVCTRNARSRYHRFLGLSYPNEHDADAAASDRRISARDHRAIVSAIRRLQRPPWRTALGGEIGVHGGGVDGDWTRGCIAVSDEDARELFDALPLGTPVEIVP